MGRDKRLAAARERAGGGPCPSGEAGNQREDTLLTLCSTQPDERSAVVEQHIVGE